MRSIMNPSLREAYMRGVNFIAMNDDPAGGGSLDVDEVANLLSVITLAEAFKKYQETVARDVIAVRREQRK